MKKIYAFITAFLGLFLVACADTSSDIDISVEEETEEVFDVCSVSYRYWDESTQTAQEIPEYLWNSTAVYPTKYTENEKTDIGALRHFRKDDTTIYAFEGWYYDTEYQNKLSGDCISATVRGDIVLYAKIVERAKQAGEKVTATISYAWNHFGTIKYGLENIPSQMIDGLDLPTEYLEGESVTLPKLKTWKQSSKITYEFDAWYYDAELKNKLANEQLSTTQTGNITLYLSLSVFVG